MPKVFISHAWEDNEISRKLAEYLRRDGAEVWIDYARIRGGDSLSETISNAIDWCDTLIMVWSKSAVNSYWVKEEWTCAHSLRKRIIPCLADSAKLPSILLSKLYIDFNNFEKGYRNLMKALKLATKEQKSISIVTKRTLKSKPKVITRKLKPIIFRNTPLELSENDVKDMLKKYDFCCQNFDWNKKFCNPTGKGINHKYKLHEINGDKVIFDEATDLIWQQSGINDYITFEDAKKWIKELNRKGFADFHDWRLPTLEEAMSLMEPNKKNDRYINPVFDSNQRWIWTADLVKGESKVWVVNFGYGGCDHHKFLYNLFVRAVRSVQSSV